MSCNCPKMSDANHDADEDKEFAEENKRIASFSSFPSSCPISATALARAGFYYTGNADQVKCFSCQAIVEGWQHGDTAIGKHRKISPNCRFISGFNLRNDCIQTQIPSIRNSDLRLDESCSQNAAQTFNHVSNSENHTEFLLRTGRVIDESKAKYPRYLDMCDEEARLKTFQNWPSYAPVAPKELAGAGLFYTGINDQVKCFCCGGKLMNWEPSDKAWTEHRKHFPDCYFVLGRDVGNVASESSRSNSRRRGSEAPDNPNMNQYKARIDSFSRWFYGTNKEALAKAGFYSIGDGDTTKCFYCGGILKNWKLKEEPWEEHAKWYPGCKFLIEEKGQHFINHIQLTRPLQNKVACSSSGASTTLPEEKESSIEEKLRQLEEEKICKLCMDRSISIVFIPCGHLVACIECAEAVDKCPICCTIIQRRQRIFMS
ncbi:E3 ubiquitin-protein ligase XIAP isoform X2 [Spea bombifrons]|uniref:E3 ubiquitin-protein ligase XIAP isoform X2 n=1 Tax=Spea bombifrons TaxID=233779 RepID=UPI00234953B9|nr:E3 ubiquitin-protein ligase XIAP isoform X2 [Spea bombifrons]